MLSSNLTSSFPACSNTSQGSPGDDREDENGGETGRGGEVQEREAMIAVDTNILVRLITQDDPQQAALAERLIQQATDEGEVCFISDVVLTYRVHERRNFGVWLLHLSSLPGLDFVGGTLSWTRVEEIWPIGLRLLSVSHSALFDSSIWPSSEPSWLGTPERRLSCRPRNHA